MTSSTDIQSSCVAAQMRRSCRSVPFVWGVDLRSRTNWTPGPWRVSRGMVEKHNRAIKNIQRPVSFREIYEELYEELASSYGETSKISIRGRERWVFCSKRTSRNSLQESLGKSLRIESGLYVWRTGFAR